MAGVLRCSSIWSAMAGAACFSRAKPSARNGLRCALWPGTGALTMGPCHTRYAPLSTDTASLDSRIERSDWSARAKRWMPRPDDTVGHPKRTLVLCFDGTGDKFDNDNSNVVQFAAALKKDNPNHQMVYYQPGIGTSKDYSRGLRKIYKVLDRMFAWSLDQRVRDGYEFLMQNYSEGDKIALFGYSRGAYTALALAGMLQKVGLLPPYNKQLLPYAYHMYALEDPEAKKLAGEFKKTFSSEVVIDFVGVWDTVCSVGLVSRHLPFVNNNNSIRIFRQALALDERRTKFRANYYRQWDQATEDTETTQPKREGGHSTDSQDKTNFLEVWFAGAHSDVGGGSVPNDTRHSLSRIPLRWMIRECFRCKTGIIFDMKMLQDDHGMDIDMNNERIMDPCKPLNTVQRERNDIQPRYAEENSSEDTTVTKTNVFFHIVTSPFRALARLGSRVRFYFLPQPQSSSHVANPPEPFKGEKMEDRHDVLSRIYDKLNIDRGWWILEWFPLKRLKGYAIHRQSQPEYHWIANCGLGRKVPHAVVQRGIKVHESVRIRLEEKGEGYVPQMRPNIIVGGAWPHTSRICRRMTHKEWVERRVDGAKLTKPWFEWVS